MKKTKVPALPEETCEIVRRAFGKVSSITSRAMCPSEDAEYLRKLAADIELVARTTKEQLDLYIGSATLLGRINDQIEGVTLCTSNDEPDDGRLP